MDENGSRAAWILSAAAAPPPLAWYQQRPLGPSPTYAGFWRRFLASSIDGFLVGIVDGILTSILDGILARVFDTEVFAEFVWVVLAVWLAASLVLSIVLDWLYHAGLESSSWQATLGKRALGIAVTDLAGDRISFARATGRHFASYISLITLLIGYLIQPFTAKRQALHDLIAGTLVVRT